MDFKSTGDAVRLLLRVVTSNFLEEASERHFQRLKEIYPEVTSATFSI
jgi:hypothetical protein